MSTTQDVNAYARKRYAQNEKVRQYHIEYATAWTRNNRDYVNLLMRAKRQDKPEYYREISRRACAKVRAENPLKAFVDSNLAVISAFLKREPKSSKPKPGRRGCSVPDFMAYLEAHMLPGMKWSEFRVTWTIKAVVKFKEFKKSEQALAFHYTNFIPVWKPVK